MRTVTSIPKYLGSIINQIYFGVNIIHALKPKARFSEGGEKIPHERLTVRKVDGVRLYFLNIMTLLKTHLRVA